MMLECRKRLAGPVLQVRIIAALGITFEQRNRVLDADIANPVLTLPEGFDDRVDAVADDAEGMRGRRSGVSTMMSEVFSSGVNRGAGCGVTRASVSEGDAAADPEVLAPTPSVLAAAN
jgi:hypothetical protein